MAEDKKTSRRWDQSQDGISAVKAVLKGSGFPLELRAAQILETFASKLPDDGSQSLVRTPLYFLDKKDSPRELDGFLALRNKIEFKQVAFHVQFHVLIECKHRENVDWFAFDVYRKPGRQYTNLLPPIASNATTEPLLLRYLEQSSHLQMPEYRISALEFVKNGVPKLAGEPLAFNVAAAAFDYFATAVNVVQRNSYSKSAALYNLQERFEMSEISYRSEKPLKNRITEFLDTLTPQDHSEYRNAFKKGLLHVVHLHVLIPILCINGSLNIARVDEGGTIGDLVPTPHVTLRLHLQQWPGALSAQVIRPAAGFPITVASIDTLNSALDYAYGMFKATCYTIGKLGEDPRLSSVPLNMALGNLLLGL